jgi:hypothetical protein
MTQQGTPRPIPIAYGELGIGSSSPTRRPSEARALETCERDYGVLEVAKRWIDLLPTGKPVEPSRENGLRLKDASIAPFVILATHRCGSIAQRVERAVQHPRSGWRREKRPRVEHRRVDALCAPPRRRSTERPRRPNRTAYILRGIDAMHRTALDSRNEWGLRHEDLIRRSCAGRALMSPNSGRARLLHRPGHPVEFIRRPSPSRGPGHVKADPRCRRFWPAS